MPTRADLGAPTLEGARRRAWLPALPCSEPHRVEDLLQPVAAEFLDSASRTSSSVGSGLRRRSSAVATTRPGAEVALNGARVRERLLHRVQAVVLGQALHRDHLVPVRLCREDETGADEAAVEEHRARATLPCSHAFFDPGRPSRSRSVSVRRLSRPDVDFTPSAVDGQRELHARHSSARRARTPSA